MFYKDTDIKKLKTQFNGIEKVKRNYSQAFQDLFVLTMLQGKTNGTYVEIGGSEPCNINNSFLLESIFGWRGISFDIDKGKVEFYNSIRTNKCFCIDATKADLNKILSDNNFPKQIDYLQIDIEPAWQTLKSLKQIDLNHYRFSVITFETDAYHGNKGVIEESRLLLSTHGYHLVASNVKDEGNAFEDWYVDRQMVDETIWKKYQCDNVECLQIIFKNHFKIYLYNLKNYLYQKVKKKYIFISWFKWQLRSKLVQVYYSSSPKKSEKWVISDDRVKAYLASCKRAALDNSFFCVFKRDPGYTHVLEHVSFEEGKKYLGKIKIKYEDKLSFIKQNDLIGSPLTYDYDTIGQISPTTLRYIKNTSDIIERFGSELDSIVEIGGGYGGLCKVLSSFINFKSYLIIDLEEVNMLSRKYISYFNLPVFSCQSDEVNTENESYDLLISNYAFSECSKEVQFDYIEKFIRKSKRFYMLYNKLDSSNIQISEFIELLSNEFHIEYEFENGVENDPKIVYGIKKWNLI